MPKKKKESVELRFYDVPQSETVLALMGESWDRVYGHEENKLHFHNLMEIGICRRGAGVLYLDEEEYRYKTGTISVFPENFPHITISDGEESNFWEYLFFNPRTVIAELYPDNPITQAEILEEINKNPLMLNQTEDKKVMALVNAIMDEEREQKLYYRSAVKNYLTNLVLEIMRMHGELKSYGEAASKTTNAMQITSALDYINKNYGKQLKAKELADVCNMSETHFRRLFEEYINMSPMDYVNLIRIQKACELMKHSDDSMDEVAIKCGFTTTSTFNRNFKKFLDTSPYQWKLNPTTYERKLLNYHITALKGW